MKHEASHAPWQPRMLVSAARWLLVALLFGASVSAAADCQKIDHTHSAWTKILQRWVHDGRVSYAALQRDGSADLDAYLAKLSATCASDYVNWSREQRLAFWINAYNAFTVRLILDNYPIASIRSIGFLPAAAFRKDFIPMPGLKGGVVSLNAIEHDTLRADFREPRIHFALVCAARSCPPLRSEAYQASDLDRQLDDQGRAFLGDPKKNRFDAPSNTLFLSRIFDWFRVDFEAVAGSLPKYVARFLQDKGATRPDVRVEFLDYDWSLNDSSPPT